MMNFINKLSKTTIASSMVAASVLGVSNISHASEVAQVQEKMHKANKDKMMPSRLVILRILKCYLHGW